jgi:hypothetical protein
VHEEGLVPVWQMQEACPQGNTGVQNPGTPVLLLQIQEVWLLCQYLQAHTAARLPLNVLRSGKWILGQPVRIHGQGYPGSERNIGKLEDAEGVIINGGQLPTCNVAEMELPSLASLTVNGR